MRTLQHVLRRRVGTTEMCTANMYAAQYPAEVLASGYASLTEARAGERRTKGMRDSVPSLVSKNERFVYDGHCSATLQLAA